MRALLLLAGVGAVMLPGIACAQSGGGLAGVEAQPRNPVAQWQRGMNQDAYIYESRRRVALKVTCRYTDGYVLWLAVPNGNFGANENRLTDQSGNLVRLYEGVSVMQLTATDQDGNAILVLPLTFWREGARTGWRTSLDAAELDAVRAADHFDMQSDRWAFQFTGRGSSAAIGGIDCDD